MKKLLMLVIAMALPVCGYAMPISHEISIETTGMPNPAVIDITLDTTMMQIGFAETAGLTINSLNFDVDGPILYQNPFGPNTVVLYGSNSGLTALGFTNDFFVQILNFGTLDATAFGAVVTQVGQSFIETGNLAIINTNVAQVPEPASLALLSLGLAALGLRRKSR